MGPVRRGLIGAVCLFCPLPLWADVCATLRPGWDGSATSGFDEVLYLLQTPLALALIIGTALALRFRSEKGGLVIVVGWSVATFLIIGWGSAAEARLAAMAQGCVGSATPFIALAALACVVLVLYTAPLRRNAD